MITSWCMAKVPACVSRGWLQNHVVVLDRFWQVPWQTNTVLYRCLSSSCYTIRLRLGKARVLCTILVGAIVRLRVCKDVLPSSALAFRLRRNNGRGNVTEWSIPDDCGRHLKMITRPNSGLKWGTGEKYKNDPRKNLRVKTWIQGQKQHTR